MPCPPTSHREMRLRSWQAEIENQASRHREYERRLGASCCGASGAQAVVDLAFIGQLQLTPQSRLKHLKCPLLEQKPIDRSTWRTCHQSPIPCLARRLVTVTAFETVSDKPLPISQLLTWTLRFCRELEAQDEYRQTPPAFGCLRAVLRVLKFRDILSRHHPASGATKMWPTVPDSLPGGLVGSTSLDPGDVGHTKLCSRSNVRERG